MSEDKSVNEASPKKLSWFRFCTVAFAAWGVAFLFFPHIVNTLYGIDHVANQYAENWLRVLGLASLMLAFLTNEAHRTASIEVKQLIARGTLFFSVPGALLIGYWQLIPNRIWSRWDISSVVVLAVVSYGMLPHTGLLRRGRPSA